MAGQSNDDLPLRTPLYERHVALGARMAPFAGYEMPIQYGKGILHEHLHTRAAAGLFDVSHMGQALLIGPDHATTAAALEALVPADIAGLGFGRQRYTQFLNEQGGILDDLMVSRGPDPADDGKLGLVVNAGCKESDYVHLDLNLPDTVKLQRNDDRALLALQGPQAVAVLSRYDEAAAGMGFMTVGSLSIGGIPTLVSRSGYTGEDGYEISVANSDAVALWDLLMSQSEVEPVGLGARDSLRLEAGLCLYGHDINQETSPVEAGLTWSIQKRRRTDGGFPGYRRIVGELAEGPLRQRVGILPQGRAPAREGTQILDASGELIGEVTSGGFGPTAEGPVAMGYVVRDFAGVGTDIQLSVRGKLLPASIVPLPFVAHRYKR
ncbi:Aminomethyltransferase (glycine cleavage system T protein) [Hyphomicrobiales bacterium]|nr:Aminomethyltransferase (glycine cleavage system T protein) [Hyphomicrobiales bacterium]CAH1671356.1 Aminomethyltransferase (glycine cleavage system T protein) [Hyphomicrobiales bacterium]